MLSEDTLDSQLYQQIMRLLAYGGNQDQWAIYHTSIAPLLQRLQDAANQGGNPAAPPARVLGNGPTDASPSADAWRRNIGIAGVWDDPPPARVLTVSASGPVTPPSPTVSASAAEMQRLPVEFTEAVGPPPDLTGPVYTMTFTNDPPPPRTYPQPWLLSNGDPVWMNVDAARLDPTDDPTTDLPPLGGSGSAP